MKKILFVLAGMFSMLIASAQKPAGAAAPPAMGRVYGKLVDSAGKPVRDASVMILQSRLDTLTKKRKDVLLKGVTSTNIGEFNIEGLPIFGPLKLTISSTGFKPVTQTITFQMKAPAGGSAPKGQMPDLSALASQFEKDLGKITLQEDAQQLAEVVITSKAKGLRMDIDKKVFNVEQNIVSAGGTAVDVMKNVPSVNVDIDGNVTVRNASPQIYIDGRPTTLTLDQIPADAIESVEVITNPSAKFDASGGNAGILNIILKKNKKSGYNGNINAGVDKRGGVNGGGSFSVRQNKVNVTVSTFGNQMKNRNTGSTSIVNLLSSPNLLVDQNSNNRMNGGFLFGRVGLDYFVTNRTTLSIGAVKVHGSFNPSDNLFTDSSFSNGNYQSYTQRTTSNNRTFNANGLTAGMKYLFPKQGEEFTMDLNYFSGKNNGESNFNTSTYNEKNGSLIGGSRQQILGNGTNQFITIQSDYVRPLKGAAKLETGVRVQLRNMSNNQSNYYYNSSTGDFVKVPSSTTNYKNKDNVYAAYVQLKNSIKDFGYQVGLRAESSDYVGELIDTKQEFTNKYPISLFPSIFLSQKLEAKQELQLSYTRRVNRPFFMQVIPFIDSSDQLNWSRGNAGLKPEFTNSLEASYSKTFKGNNTILASAYYKYTTDLITRYLDTLSFNGEKRPINTYINANSSRTVGFELTSTNTITNWWDMNSNINVYNSKINTDNISGSSQDPMWSYFAKLNSNFKLPKNFKVQLSGTYQSKTNLPVNSGGMGFGGPGMGGAQSAAQGYIKSNYGIDLALQKSFLKNNAASITLSVSDIFGTRRMDQYSVSNFFIQESHRLGDVPMFRLNFSYRFGQMDMSLFKRKNMKGEAEGAQGAMQGIQ
jgi:ferric enterobactin receptor